MSTQNVNYMASYIAGADLSAKQFYAVKLTAARTVGLAGAGQGFGILDNKPVLGAAAGVIHYGLSKAVAGAAVSAGARVQLMQMARLLLLRRLLVSTQIVLVGQLKLLVVMVRFSPLWLCPIRSRPTTNFWLHFLFSHFLAIRRI